MVKEKSCDHGENSLVSTELECFSKNSHPYEPGLLYNYP